MMAWLTLGGIIISLLYGIAIWGTHANLFGRTVGEDDEV